MKSQTTRQILLQYVRTDKNGNVDASDMLSEECYKEWVRTRKTAPRVPHTAFRDAIKKVLIGSSRVTPFPAKVEAAVLALMREREVWPCFAHIPHVGIGKRGWRVRGYHQRKMDCSSDDDTQSTGTNHADLTNTEEEGEEETKDSDETKDNAKGPIDEFLIPRFDSTLGKEAIRNERACLVRRKMSSCEITRKDSFRPASRRPRVQRFSSSYYSVDSRNILLSLLPTKAESAQTQSEQSEFNGGDSELHSEVFEPLPMRKPVSFSTGVSSNSLNRFNARRRSNTDLGMMTRTLHSKNTVMQGNQFQNSQEPEINEHFGTIMPFSHDWAEHRRYSYPSPELIQPRFGSSNKQHQQQEMDYCTEWLNQHTFHTEF